MAGCLSRARVLATIAVFGSLLLGACSGGDEDAPTARRSSVKAAATCKETKDCKNGLVCDDGKCGACSDNAQCEGGKICSDGACSACASSDQCTSGMVCKQGACGPCTQDSECKSPATCDPDLKRCSTPKSTRVDTDGGTPSSVARVYAGSVPNVPSRWAQNGMVGYEAGNAMCAGVAAGSKPCSYGQMKRAFQNGELNALSGTAWMNRTSADPAEPNAGPAAASARCDDYRYNTNHLNDGEYVEFKQGQMVPYFDMDTSKPQPISGKTLPCNGAQRQLLCCTGP